MQLGRALTPEEARSGRYGRDQVIRSGNGLYLRPTGGGAPAAASAPSAPTPDSVTQSFLDQLKPLFGGQPKPTITPFDQSGFFNEADVRGAANAEYDPYAAKQKVYTDALNANQDKNTLETVNAAGGYGSSAFAKEQELRRQALQRSGEDQTNAVAGQKEQFALNRRNEAYQRYLQSIGALTS